MSDTLLDQLQHPDKNGLVLPSESEQVAEIYRHLMSGGMPESGVEWKRQIMLAIMVGRAMERLENCPPAAR